VEQVADALVKLKHPSGGYVPDLERFSGPEGKVLVGEAFTVEVRLTCFPVSPFMDTDILAHSDGRRKGQRSAEARGALCAFVSLAKRSRAAVPAASRPDPARLLMPYHDRSMRQTQTASCSSRRQLVRASRTPPRRAPGGLTLRVRTADTKSASLGGLLATALQRKGVRGVVTSGRCRDLAELRALDFPVRSRVLSLL